MTFQTLVIILIIVKRPETFAIQFTPLAYGSSSRVSEHVFYPPSVAEERSKIVLAAELVNFSLCQIDFFLTTTCVVCQNIGTLIVVHKMMGLMMTTLFSSSDTSCGFLQRRY